MKGDALNTMAELVDKLRRCAAQEDRHGFLETRAELERLICERSFSARLAHLFEIRLSRAHAIECFTCPFPLHGKGCALL